MSILITGGAGFIGSNYIEYVFSNDPRERIVCVDALTYAGNLSTLNRFDDYQNFVFYKQDICDRDGIEESFKKEKPEYVINFAAESHVDRSIENSAVFLQSNILGVAVLMDACLKYHVKRFHQVSTDEVYGELPANNRELLFCENDLLKAGNPYAASKASADLLVLSYVKTHGLNATISRCTNNYGPYQLTEKLIPLIITNCIKGLPLPLYGSGENIRDWIFVTDHCQAIDMIVSKGISGEIYNVGSNNEITNIELVKKICDKCGTDHAQIHFVPDRKGHDWRYALNTSKLIQQIGWRPTVAFEDGLDFTVNWYQNNRQWWDK